MPRSRAARRMPRGERQWGEALVDIRADHRARYEWAGDFLSGYLTPHSAVLDAACGCGYGTAMLADALPRSFVSGVDVNPGALDWAVRYWKRPNNAFAQMDVSRFDVLGASFDAIVSFETVEHVEADTAVLAGFSRTLRPGGVLIVSVPNQAVIPFNKRKYPFHVRHYTPMELDALLQLAGFSVLEWRTQHPGENEVRYGSDGKTIIAPARKP
jgi:2-polyprenyl-3-methyl-5-hydroxy-6-metoxy-1,4-benzoquinol methylase